MNKKRFIVIVLDGFGVGEMDDVPLVRPADKGAATAQHILERTAARLPELERLGLYNVMGCCPERQSPTATAGRCALKHFGADTFFGHQEIMGTMPFAPVKRAFYHDLPAVKAALLAAGHQVREAKCAGSTLLVVDEAVTIGDNIEADLGQAHNVTAALDLLPFERVVEIGGIVRSVVKVSRVIVFGGRGVSLEQLLAAREYKELCGEHYDGVNAPRSGVYQYDYQCVHLGYGVNPSVQLPTLLGARGIPVTLIGKVADIVANPNGRSIAVVDTAQAMQYTIDAMRSGAGGFICTNIQETDLCGHRMDTAAYAAKLSIADSYLAKITEMMQEDDVLVVMADHGNDPTVGHSRHTREYVPLLITGNKVQGGVNLGTRSTLADVGATAGEYLGVALPENGSSFLSDILSDLP